MFSVRCENKTKKVRMCRVLSVGSADENLELIRRVGREWNNLSKTSGSTNLLAFENSFRCMRSPISLVIVMVEYQASQLGD